MEYRGRGPVVVKTYLKDGKKCFYRAIKILISRRLYFLHYSYTDVENWIYRSLYNTLTKIIATKELNS